MTAGGADTAGTIPGGSGRTLLTSVPGEALPNRTELVLDIGLICR